MIKKLLSIVLLFVLFLVYIIIVIPFGLLWKLIKPVLYTSGNSNYKKISKTYSEKDFRRSW